MSFVDSENLRDEVKSATGGAPIRLALNAVGGENALRREYARAGSNHGDLRCDEFSTAAHSERFAYLQKPSLLRISGKQMGRSGDARARIETFTPLFDMAQRGLLKTKVGKSYLLGEAKAALTHAAQNKRSGKIIFEFSL